jgi:hypothetical protein
MHAAAGVSARGETVRETFGAFGLDRRTGKSGVIPDGCYDIDGTRAGDHLGWTARPATLAHEQSRQRRADDILRGANEIAKFIFGERGNRRKVYYLAECIWLPVFRLGSLLCARRSVLLN